MAKLIVVLAFLACVALVLAADPEPEKKKDDKGTDLQTANSFYGFGFPYGGYGGYGLGWGGYGGYGFPYYGGYGYRGFYGGFPGYGGFGFYG